MKTRSKLATLVLTALLFFAGAAHAAVPETISYQGRLIDDTGAPVNATVDITFRLYKGPSGGIESWTETHTGLVVTDGLFDVLLGSVEPLEDVFTGSTRYLSVQVDAGPESTDRVPMVSVPYSFRSAYADSAGGDWVSKYGDTMAGDLVWDVSDDGAAEACLNVGGDWANLELSDDGLMHANLWGQSYGTLELFDGDGTISATLDAGGTGGGRAILRDSEGGLRILLRAEGVGSGAVQFPDDAVESSEILNEPGIATAWSFSDVEITTDTIFTTLVSVSITIPAPGYIHLNGKCVLEMTMNRSSSWVKVQITDDPLYPGGAIDCGATDIFLPENDQYFAHRYPAVAMHDAYKETAGTYTFYLQTAYRWTTHPTDNAFADYSYLSAIYIPTSYGPVKSATAQVGPAQSPKDATPPTVIEETDLRDLELQVERARRAAAEAELKLERARSAQAQD